MALRNTSPIRFRFKRFIFFFSLFVELLVHMLRKALHGMEQGGLIPNDFEHILKKIGKDGRQFR